MTSIFVAMENSVLAIHSSKDGWRSEEHLEGTSPQCIAVDPHHSERVYCGTFEHGLWRSDDLGVSWRKVGNGIAYSKVMSVAVSPVERIGKLGVVYAGTEPSSLFRSEDGGKTWEEKTALNRLPSSKSWSFPPRPYTHHIRWIATDPIVPAQLFVAIEAGALVHSRDAGSTWEDRVPDGPFDTHTLVIHPTTRGRIYSSAGDCYYESNDGGLTWHKPRVGLRHYYLYGLAVDPTDPDAIVVSASSGPWSAHSSTEAESFIYIKTKDQNWKLVEKGLPEPGGTIISMLTANSSGEFYAANNRGVYCSVAGTVWKKLDIPWPQSYLSQHPWGIALVEAD